MVYGVWGGLPRNFASEPFTPGRNGKGHAQAAQMVANGMQFTVTGLNSGTTYAFNLTAKSEDNIVASYFETNEVPSITTEVDNISVTNKAVKYFRNGQLFIERNGHTYNAQGAEIR